jgi:CheY-like chemotaxis protein/pyrroloquinoline quinone (PQQ) biosynthesis protein C/HPt (histidine-containing phosphotransfer) domain-containing protein
MPDPVTQQTAAGDARFVLVVDDNPINREVAICMLESLGYQTDSAVNGVEALEACAASRYAAILMDLQMPELDGYGATLQLRKREGGSAPTPILAMTAHAMESDRQRALDIGMNDYITKPIGIGALAQLMQRWAPFTATQTPDARAPRQPAAGDAVNEFVLEDLRAAQQKGRPNIVLKVLRLTVAELKDIEPRIERAWGKDGINAVGRLAHSLKASMSMVGAEALSRICAELEDACRADDEPTAHVRYTAFRQERARVLPTVEGMLLREEQDEYRSAGSSVVSAERFIVDLLEEAHAHRATAHRFLHRFGEEALTREQLASFTSQYYLYSRFFGGNLAAVIANIPDEGARNALIVNLYEDIGEPLKIRDIVHVLLLNAGLITAQDVSDALVSKVGGRDVVGVLIAKGTVTRDQVRALVAAESERAQDRSHPALFRRFLHAIGLDADQISGVEPLPETAAFIETYQQLCREGHFLTAMGAMGPGTECVTPALYTPIERGIERSGVVLAEDYIFWTIHIAAAEGHGLAFCKSMIPYVGTVQGQRLVAEGARRVLDARACWFEGLERLVFAPQAPRFGARAAAVAAARAQPDELALADFTAGPAVLALCEPVWGKRALELGGGEGSFTRKLRRAGADVRGIEVSGAIDLSRCDTATFDIVVAIGRFDDLTLAETRRGMLEVARVLKVGGSFVFAVPHPALPFVRKPERPFFLDAAGAGYIAARGRRFSGRLWQRDGTGLDVHLVHKTVEDYLAALADAGFSSMPVVRVAGYEISSLLRVGSALTAVS